MLFNLLADTTDASNKTGSNWVFWVLLAVVAVFMVGSMYFMNRRNKKHQQEADELIDAVKPGNKVKTIGGVCGIVVEVDKEENTFVLETGSETSGKCYMKFDRQAILQSDAVVEKSSAKPEKKEEEPAIEQNVAEAEAPVEEVKTEDTPASEE